MLILERDRVFARSNPRTWVRAKVDNEFCRFGIDLHGKLKVIDEFGLPVQVISDNYFQFAGHTVHVEVLKGNSPRKCRVGVTVPDAVELLRGELCASE